MKKNIVALVMLCTSAVGLGFGAPAKAAIGENTIGPAIGIGNGTTTIGIDSKFGVSDTLSVRPFVFFPNGATTFGAGLTYDFSLPNPAKVVQITPFLGGGVAIASASGVSNSSTTVYLTGGADFAINENIELKAALSIPLTSGQTTNVVLGAGYRF
jgi:hypothetical protein